MIKSKVLAGLGRADESAAAERKALAVATPEQSYDFGRQQLAAKHTDEALAVFRANAAQHPDLWFVHDGMARAYSALGRFPEAAKEMKTAIADAPAAGKDALGVLLKRLQSKQDISQ
jgi:Flp pilus assembly protein TadD